MALLVSPADLRSAARLTSRIGEIGGVPRDNPWKGIHRIKSANGRLILMTTDGTLALDWSIPCENACEGDLDEGIDSATFDALASHPAEGDPYEITRDEGLILTQVGSMKFRPQGGSRNLRLPGRAYPPFPPRVLTGRPDAPDHASHRWTIPAASLARALAFVAPFIGAKNPNESRSVATWTSDGLLAGGSPKKAALVKGLPGAQTPLSFGRRTALATAAFLERLKGDVEIRVGVARYAFTCASAGHSLEVQAGSAAFPVQFLRLADPPNETYKIDRETFLSTVDILEVLMLTRSGNLEFLVKGKDELASIHLSTPGSTIALSDDEFAIIRSVTPRSNQPPGPGRSPDGLTFPTQFWTNGRLLREVLNKMEGVILVCHFDPRNKHIRLEEEKAVGGIVRSVILSVLIPATSDGRTRPSPGSEESPAADSGSQRPTGDSSASSLDGGLRESGRATV